MSDEAQPVVLTQEELDLILTNVDMIGVNNIHNMQWRKASKRAAALGWSGSVTLRADVSAADGNAAEALWRFFNRGAPVLRELVLAVRTAQAERDAAVSRAELAEHLTKVLQGRLDEGPIDEGGVSQEMRDMTAKLEQTAVAVQAAAIRALEAERDQLKAACIELNAALSRIDYVLGEPNEMECSSYDVHANPEAVVARVAALRAEKEST